LGVKLGQYEAAYFTFINQVYERAILPFDQKKSKPCQLKLFQGAVECEKAAQGLRRYRRAALITIKS
jgi:hypothetical protein